MAEGRGKRIEIGEREGRRGRGRRGETVKRWEEENNEERIRERMGREDEEGRGKMSKKEMDMS